MKWFLMGFFFRAPIILDESDHSCKLCVKWNPTLIENWKQYCISWIELIVTKNKHSQFNFEPDQVTTFSGFNTLITINKCD